MGLTGAQYNVSIPSYFLENYFVDLMTNLKTQTIQRIDTKVEFWKMVKFTTMRRIAVVEVPSVRF